VCSSDLAIPEDFETGRPVTNWWEASATARDRWALRGKVPTRKNNSLLGLRLSRECGSCAHDTKGPDYYAQLARLEP